MQRVFTPVYFITYIIEYRHLKRINIFVLLIIYKFYQNREDIPKYLERHDEKQGPNLVRIRQATFTATLQRPIYVIPAERLLLLLQTIHNKHIEAVKARIVPTEW